MSAVNAKALCFFTMKRKYEAPDGKIISFDGSIAKISSMNYPGHAWGFRSGGTQLSIQRSNKFQQVFRFISSGRAENSYYIQSFGGTFSGLWLFIDESDSELILSEDRSIFKASFIDIVADKLLVRFATKDNQCIRHSNYLLRADTHSPTDRPWIEDSEWMISFLSEEEIPTAPSTPSNIIREVASLQFHRPLFIHIQECWKDPFVRELRLRALLDCVDTCILSSQQGSRISKEGSRVMSYPLQGAGGMAANTAGATAISMLRPGSPVDEHLKRRIEEATTVHSRGGLKSFVIPSAEISDIVKDLSKQALAEMRRMKMFGLVKNRTFDLELGFCEWVSLPEGCEILPHRDGGNDCDVAAIFCIHNKAECTVEGTTFMLDEGQMYIFEPQKYTHSVGTPLLPGPRHVVALRFFRV